MAGKGKIVIALAEAACSLSKMGKNSTFRANPKLLKTALPFNKKTEILP